MYRVTKQVFVLLCVGQGVRIAGLQCAAASCLFCLGRGSFLFASEWDPWGGCLWLFFDDFVGDGGGGGGRVDVLVVAAAAAAVVFFVVAEKKRWWIGRKTVFRREEALPCEGPLCRLETSYCSST